MGAERTNGLVYGWTGLPITSRTAQEAIVINVNNLRRVGPVTIAES
ncbi:hypothetical protein [Catenuloplanes indicus]|uniref:Uncharacterized protein n=1 Tax=Catenuloplanes indicus TaxID=137267 RepID=A0AAE3VUX0_9ACTN|nr:hypothetical protein [Catenuloplanes indicus]MDQ0364181.1 hypothetical protein [Catenuloplanes indicus]